MYTILDYQKDKSFGEIFFEIQNSEIFLKFRNREILTDRIFKFIRITMYILFLVPAAIEMIDCDL